MAITTTRRITGGARRRRALTALCLAAALAVPALASAQPSRFGMVTTIAPGDRAELSVGAVPRGEFAFTLRAASDADRRFTLTQKRNGGSRFVVLRAPGPMVSQTCQGAAGSLVCSGITTPATPAGRTWTFRVLNSGSRPLSVTLSIVHRKVTSAG